jgi:hypothetical protein
MQQLLKPNTGEFTTKVVDGEAILINLSNGMYYSMDLVGGFVWQLIEAGHGIDGIIEAVAGRYGVSEATVKQDIEQLAQQLLDEKIVLSANGEAAAEPVEIEAAAAPEAYAVPQLEKFDDMVDLFALDPPLPELSKLSDLG